MQMVSDNDGIKSGASLWRLDYTNNTLSLITSSPGGLGGKCYALVFNKIF